MADKQTNDPQTPWAVGTKVLCINPKCFMFGEEGVVKAASDDGWIIVEYPKGVLTSSHSKDYAEEGGFDA